LDWGIYPRSKRGGKKETESAPLVVSRQFLPDHLGTVVVEVCVADPFAQMGTLDPFTVLTKALRGKRVRMV